LTGFTGFSGCFLSFRMKMRTSSSEEDHPVNPVS
jgi:hypothetical protein